MPEPKRTAHPQRNLTLDDMDIHVAPTPKDVALKVADALSSNVIENNDSVLADVLDAINDGYAGVILSGPPGTSKSWYAKAVAENLSAGDGSLVRFIQFHPSYQYEDFVQGWVADGTGGFVLTDKHFLNLCTDALGNPSKLHILVIDEISRCDVSRVFGEALTYLESSKRALPFLLASGKLVQVPKNLFVIGTMNPWDITVDELDFALERRFAFITMQPRSDTVQKFLQDNGLEEVLVQGVVRFFNFLQGRNNPLLRLGHAYFSRVVDSSSLVRLWKFQIHPHLAKVTRLDPSELQAIEGAWKQLVLSQLPDAKAEEAPEVQLPAEDRLAVR